MTVLPTGTLRELALHLVVDYDALRRQVERAGLQPVATRWDGRQQSRVYLLADVARVEARAGRRRAARPRALTYLTQASMILTGSEDVAETP